MTSTLVHAREVPNFAGLECSGEVHPEQNEESAPGDTEKAVSHHHGCHHSLSSLNAMVVGGGLINLDSASYARAAIDFPIFQIFGLDLRPPIA
ncbi:MAG: hypothetical protein E2598_08035 [Sphingobium sp.]|nr:hypothetical protein [Sphingobium sp.]